MIELFTSLGKLAIGFLCILGPFVLPIAFLRTRDLREAALSTRVLQELNSKELNVMRAHIVLAHSVSGSIGAR